MEVLKAERRKYRSKLAENKERTPEKTRVRLRKMILPALPRNNRKFRPPIFLAIIFGVIGSHRL